MILTHATVITAVINGEILPDHGVYMEGGIIREIAPSHVLIAKYPHESQYDARGQYVMPGNICAHTHFYGAFARGMAIPGDAPRDFPEILSRLWWNLDKALDTDAVRLSAQVCLIDAIKHGTTTLFDHHASPFALENSLDVIGDAVQQAGLRAVLCYEVTDRDGIEKADAGIAENVRFIQSHRDHPTLRGIFGLHASLSLSDDTLHKCADSLPAGVGVHIHVAEHEADEIDSADRYEMRVVERLHRFGLLGEHTIAAHCVHIDALEHALLRDTRTWVTHQPRSNMNNAVGAMAFDGMMKDKMRVLIGNDGFSNAMWEEWKAAYFLHKVVSRDPRRANGYDVAYAATVTNAQLASAAFGAPIGTLTVGSRADMMVVDYHPFTPFTTGNLPWHIIFGLESSAVTGTICEGVILMQDRELKTMDERAIAEAARAHAPAIWGRYNEIAKQTP
jgi:putative selenium metabolism protein SsnA